MPIGSILGIIGGIAGGAGQTAWQMDQSRKSAHQQMDFEREMSNTSYQRAVKDMQAAGLNPMLAYSQGGASTPGVQQQQVVATPNFMTSASQAVQQVADIQKTKQDTNTQGAVEMAQSAKAELDTASAYRVNYENMNMLESLRREALANANKSESEAMLKWIEQQKEKIRYAGIEHWDEPDYRPGGGSVSGDVVDRVKQEYQRQKGDTKKAVSAGEIEEARVAGERADERAYKRFGGDALPYVDRAAKILGGIGASAYGVSKLLPRRSGSGYTSRVPRADRSDIED